MHKNTLFVSGAMVTALAFASTGQAKMLSGNYCSTADVSLPAGYVVDSNWNNLTSVAPSPIYSSIDTASGPGGSAATGKDVLHYSDGSVVPAATTISWTSTSQNANDSRFIFTSVSTSRVQSLSPRLTATAVTTR